MQIILHWNQNRDNHNAQNEGNNEQQTVVAYFASLPIQADPPSRYNENTASSLISHILTLRELMFNRDVV